MKKIVSLVLLVLSVLIFFIYSNYTKGFFDYDIAQQIGYFFYWSVDLFILSLIAQVIAVDRYRKWITISLIFSILSIIFAYIMGSGNGSIVSVDGKLTTWFLVGLYSAVSIIYFIIQFFRQRKSRQF